MDASILKPEFGPTLGQLLAPRWHAAPPAKRRAIKALGVLLIAVAGLIAIFFPRDGWIVHHSRATTFNLRYPTGLHRTTPRTGEYARIEGGGASFTLSPLHLPHYGGEVSGVEPLFAASYIAALAARTPGFQLQSEGKTRVNTTPGYTFTFSSGAGSQRLLSRVVFLTPGIVASRDGVTMTMSIRPNAMDPTPDQVAVNDVLQEPLRSFRFGA